MEPVIGFALCGSFCTFSRVLDVLERLKTQYPNIIPILSEASYTTDTRFGAAADFRARIEAICGHEILHTIAQTEPIGPKKLSTASSSRPATGNTLAKLACGIADGPRDPRRQGPSAQRASHRPRRLDERRPRGQRAPPSARCSPGGTIILSPSRRTTPPRSRAPWSRTSIFCPRPSPPPSKAVSFSRFWLNQSANRNTSGTVPGSNVRSAMRYMAFA